MADYIERTALRDALYFADAITMQGMKILNQFPAAEVEPVRHGQWRRTGRIFDGFIEVQCSECEETHLFDMIRLETAARYCAYCGVKWDGGADGAN